MRNLFIELNKQSANNTIILTNAFGLLYESLCFMQNRSLKVFDNQYHLVANLHPN
jgi:hypothetical protein